MTSENTGSNNGQKNKAKVYNNQCKFNFNV